MKGDATALAEAWVAYDAAHELWERATLNFRLSLNSRSNPALVLAAERRQREAAVAVRTAYAVAYRLTTEGE